MLASGEAMVLHLVETLARLVSGIFKNILDMIVKCIYRDLEQGLVTATSVNVECLRLSLLRACVCEDLHSLIYLSLTQGIR